MRVSSLFIALIFLVVVQTMSAAIMTSSTLLPGQKFRVVFLTDSATDATSAEVSHYDGIVQIEAAAAGMASYDGLPVVWRALVSTELVSAILRLPADDVPVFLPSGNMVTTGSAALWSTGIEPGHPLLHAIDENAYGAVIGSPAFGPDVWTGTNYLGYGLPAATLGELLPAYGYINVSTNWINSSTGPASNRFPVYGFSSVLTVGQAAPVNEPTSLTISFIGIVLALGGRFVKNLNCHDFSIIGSQRNRHTYRLAKLPKRTGQGSASCAEREPGDGK